MTESRIPLVIYHANCYDGFTAAWIACRAMNCEIEPASYGDPPPLFSNLEGRDVYIIDFSYPRDVMEKMSRVAASLVVLDHHKTAQADCEGLSFCTFDMERSGCRLAWDFFFTGEDVPHWIACIEDRDLWRFDLDETQSTHAYVASLPMTLENWDRLHDMPMGDILDGGFAIRTYIETFVAKAAESARVISFRGFAVVVLNITYQNVSEAGHFLLKGHPAADFYMGYFQTAEGKWQYSLRSRAGFDVSSIAKRFGGGGHAQASGFYTEKLLDELA